MILRSFALATLPTVVTAMLLTCLDVDPLQMGQVIGGGRTFLSPPSTMFVGIGLRMCPVPRCRCRNSSRPVGGIVTKLADVRLCVLSLRACPFFLRVGRTLKALFLENGFTMCRVIFPLSGACCLRVLRPVCPFLRTIGLTMLVPPRVLHGLDVVDILLSIDALLRPKFSTMLLSPCAFIGIPRFTILCVIFSIIIRTREWDRGHGRLLAVDGWCSGL